MTKGGPYTLVFTVQTRVPFPDSDADAATIPLIVTREVTVVVDGDAPSTANCDAPLG